MLQEVKGLVKGGGEGGWNHTEGVLGGARSPRKKKGQEGAGKTKKKQWLEKEGLAIIRKLYTTQGGKLGSGERKRTVIQGRAGSLLY